jgi:hypothetical protein
MADQDPFSGLRTGPWVGVNNDPVFKGLTDENTVVPGGVIENQSITNAKIVNLNAEKIDAGTLKVTGSMSIETSGATPQLEIGPTGTIMRDNAGNTILEINGATTTLNADVINSGTINGDNVDVTNINADNIETGALTLTPLDDGSGNAIVSTNFTVSSTGSVTAKDLTIIPSTSESQGIDAAAGAIILEPPTAFGAVVLKVTNSDGTGDFDTVGFTSSPGAAADAISTITTDSTHNLRAGQMVSFHNVQTAWNLITAAAPIQILGGVNAPTATTFKIKHFLALPSVSANSAGTIQAYKRLSVRAAGGLYVYRDGSKSGDIAAGSLVLGNNLENYGNGSLATVADGELAFIAAATPRYGNGANLYSKNGTNNVSTSGNFDVAGDIDIGVSDTSTAGAIIFKGGNGGSIRAFSAAAGNDSLGIYNTAGSDYSNLVAESFFPGGQGSFRLTHDGNFDFNDTVDVTGSITATGTVTATGNVNGNNFNGTALICDGIPTTTNTTNNAVWFNNVSTNYTLRRFTSSQRYKTDIVDADEVVLEAAKKIRPRHFTSLLEDENGATRLGFIAEEVEAAGLTHAVGYDFDGRVETIDTTALLAALYARVNDLEARLAALEGA